MPIPAGVTLGGVAGIDSCGSLRRAAVLEAEVLSVAADVAYRLCGAPLLRVNNLKILRGLCDALAIPGELRGRVARVVTAALYSCFKTQTPVASGATLKRTSSCALSPVCVCVCVTVLADIPRARACACVWDFWRLAGCVCV